MKMDSYQWSYLLSPEANPMFEKIADFIQENDCHSIVDIGCGVSRVNEHLKDYDYRLFGVDNDDECIDYCEENYPQHDFARLCGWDYKHWYGRDSKEYDCLILSGFMYYCGKHGNPELDEYIEGLIETVKPRIVIIAEPHPSDAYKSPDFSNLFDRYAYEAVPFILDIRMGDRNVYCLYTDKKRPERKIKAQFNSEKDHQKQDDFDSNILKHGVYITNTENINNDVDGRLDPADPEIKTYISVAAGYKSLLKAALDGHTKPDFKFVYLDISLTAIDWKMVSDRWVCERGIHDDFDQIYDIYTDGINHRILPIYGSGIPKINYMLKKQRDSLGISDSDWEKFINLYSQVPKYYFRLDIVNNVKMLKKFLDKTVDQEEKSWFWYSNVFDWHQFRFNENHHANWKNYLQQRFPNMQLVGKGPPFTSS